jgi:uncharacterized Zn-binding protein involved in type VI secretion
MHTCPMVTGVVPHVGGPILPPGAPTVLIDFLPAATVSTMATCVGPPDVIVLGSMGVMINFIPAARLGDLTAHGGVIVMGSPTCIIGEVGSPSPGAGGLGGVVGGMAASGVTAKNIAAQGSVLAQSRAAAIADSSTFETHGLDNDAADKYLSTPEGEEFLDALSSADPSASYDAIRARAVLQLKTGYNPPVMHTIDKPLVKIVPQGSSVSPYSPFFTTREELQAAMSSEKSLPDYFGLPLASHATTYDVYQITPSRPTNVWASKIAPTSELGGNVTTSGGGIQCLVPNRNVKGGSAWSSPKLVGTIRK